MLAALSMDPKLIVIVIFRVKYLDLRILLSQVINLLRPLVSFVINLDLNPNTCAKS